MIFYCAPHSLLHHSVGEFLGSWGRDLASVFTPLAYGRLFRASTLRSGVYIFTHFEVLTPLQRRLVRRLHDRLLRQPQSFRVLNNPARFLDRAQLLDTLYRIGVNDFRAARLDAPLRDLRYPVFLRLADEHFSFDFRLLHSPAELEAERRRLLDASPRLRPHDILVAEFRDVSDAEGRYRKYSALRIGDRFIPRHVLASRNWMTKYPDLVDNRSIQEEQQYIDQSPHEARLRPVFDLVGLQYGRIDYAVHDDRLCVWEINSNPVIVPALERTDSRRHASQSQSARLVLEAFRDLDAQPLADAEIPAWGWLDRFSLKHAVRDSRDDQERRKALSQWAARDRAAHSGTPASE